MMMMVMMVINDVTRCPNP